MTDRLIRVFLGAVVAGLASPGSQAQPVTINFDNSGDEAGITTPGTENFEFMGSSWSGGVIRTEGVPALYASGAFSYEVLDGPAMVVFDQPAEGIEFFFVHAAGIPAGIATALDAGGDALATVDSNAATQFGAPANFVSFDGAVSAIEFTGGAIDNFTYTLTEPVAINFQDIDGNWVTDDAEFQGNSQGFALDFLASANLVFGAWFTYRTMPEAIPADELDDDVGAPDNRWLTMQLSIDGNVASGPIFQSTGGGFDQPPTGFQQITEVGTMTIEFTACDAGRVSYAVDQQTREFMIIPLEKRIAGSDFECRSEIGSANGGPPY